MKAIAWVALLAGMALPAVALGAGLAHNENFIVLAPDQLLADEVLAKANTYRVELAKELFGKELPAGAGRTIIDVSLPKDKEFALTWPIDSPQRECHKMWLTATEENAVGPTLRHEMVHVLLATRFPNQLPKWLDEGLASRQDDAARIRIRRQLMDSCAGSGNWPNLKEILDRQLIGADDQKAYSVVSSMVDYLLSRGDMATLLKFGVAQKARGWDAALEQHYHIATLRQLQQGWREWVGRQAGVRATALNVSR
jgi:hypothetical protein